MNLSRYPRRFTAVPLLCGTLLAGCASGPSVAPVPAGPEIDSATQSRHAAAAERLEQNAATMPEGGDAAWLAAARAWANAGEYARAATNLTHVDVFRLTARETIDYDLLNAEIAFYNADFAAAAEILNTLPADLKTAERNAAAALAERVAEAQRAPAATIAAWLEAARRQADAERLVALFLRLGTLKNDVLQRDLEQSPDARLTAWIALGREVRAQVADGQVAAIDLRGWRDSDGGNFPDPELAAALAERFALEYRQPARIAVLLPLAGSLASAAAAIQHGLLSAWSALPVAARPELLFFRLGDQPAEAAAALYEARDAGAEWVIGPLQRDAVDQVLAVPGNTLPLLLLNRPGDEAAAAAARQAGLPVYTLALWPEDEALEAAVMALADGHRSALLIASDDPWGDRVAAAFSEALTLGGGRVLAAGRFAPDANDHRAVLRNVLGIDAAEARHRRLQSRLGVPLGFNPLPRQDAEAILLAARATRAREIVPQLRFLDAGDIPLYGLSTIIEGGEDERAARDLAGIHFPLAPWLAGAGGPTPVREEAASWYREVETTTGAQLFALGMDALAILPRLALLRGDGQLRFNGANGRIRIDDRGEAHRELQPAIFGRRGVRLLEKPPPEIEPQR